MQRSVILMLLGMMALNAATHERVADQLRVQLSPAVELSFTLVDDQLLGLTTATVNGIATTAADTHWRPSLAQDLVGAPVLTHALVLKEVRAQDTGIALVCDVHATTATEAFTRYYTMAPDPAAVVEDDELRAMRIAAEAADAEITELVIAGDKRSARNQARIDALLAETSTDPRDRQVRNTRLMDARARFAKDRRKALAKTLADDPDIAELQQVVARHQAALARRAQQHLQINDDYFGHPIPHLPAETATTANLTALAAKPGAVCGTLTWILQPQTVNIAGWDWQGWQQQIVYEGLQTVRLPGPPAAGHLGTGWPGGRHHRSRHALPRPRVDRGDLPR